jgi:uncharacterized protein (TIGR03086 family)
MPASPLDLYRRTAQWYREKVAGARCLDARTAYADWAVRDLLNHVLQNQRKLTACARGGDATPHGAALRYHTDNPVGDFALARIDVLRAFAPAGIIEATAPLLCMAFCDLLLHGWDLARATDQDAEMPAGLAEAAFDVMRHAPADEQRLCRLEPAVPVRKGAPAQQRLLGYSGRICDTSAVEAELSPHDLALRRQSSAPRRSQRPGDRDATATLGFR